MGGTNLVVKKVNCSPRVKFVIRAVDSVKSTLDKVVVVVSEVWHINVSVLKPGLREANMNGVRLYSRDNCSNK